jgi:hypothetical protein
LAAAQGFAGRAFPSGSVIPFADLQKPASGRPYHAARSSRFTWEHRG